MSMTHSNFKQDLLRPEAYAAIARTARVSLIETHIAWIFLLDRDVFKIKKPVNLGFLDFHTLERRKAACEAEIRLNARLAPHVYLGTVPVRMDANGRVHLGESGTIVDWAVHMLRLPDDARTDNLLARGALTPRIIDAIACRVAVFHADLRIDPSREQFGAPSMLARNLEENFAQTQETLERYLRPEDANNLMRWQRAFLLGHIGLFENRVNRGRVRDGHGDLRLQHIYVEGDRVIVVDGTEFNDRFRFADVCADIASLSMDLAGHGRVDLAERLLATYARESNDFDLYAVVDFYESYRAFVRGKIATIVADDPSVDFETRERATREARRCYLLALSADRRPLLLPSVVAVGGVIASGKSTIAERIGQAMNAPVIDADRTRKAMLSVPPTRPLHDPAWSGAYDPEFTERVYIEVLRRAGVVLASGRPVVIDASFRSDSMRRAARELAKLHNVPFHFVECRAPKNVCLERLARREGSVSDGRTAIFDDFCAHFEPISELPRTEHVVLDTTKAPDESLSRLRNELDTWPSEAVRR